MTFYSLQMSTAFIFEKFPVLKIYVLPRVRSFDIYPTVSGELMCTFPSSSFWLLDILYLLLGNNGFDFLSPPSLLYGVEAFDYLLRLRILIAFCETRRVWCIVSLCCTLLCEVLIIWVKKSRKEKWLIMQLVRSRTKNQNVYWICWLLIIFKLLSPSLICDNVAHYRTNA